MLGVGSGEALNEHILGDAWPQTDVRLEMLEEAVEVMRELWRGGFVNHHGKHYTVENARIYTLPDTPPPIYVSGFGPKAVDLAARIGDGYISTMPDADRSAGSATAAAATSRARPASRRLRRRPRTRACGSRTSSGRTPGVPGELSQVLPSPRHFEQAAAAGQPEMMGVVRLRPDADAHLEMIDQYADAGFDEVYVANTGPHYQGLFDLYQRGAARPR